MRILTAAFVLTLLYAHRDGDLLDQPLSMFRDGEQQHLGEILFLLLGLIGGVLIRKLWSLRSFAGVSVLGLAFLLLLNVALTPSFDPIHHACALLLLSLVSGYYTVWLDHQSPNWLFPHVALTSIIVFGAGCGEYGFWQKALILYVVLLINLQYSSLTMPARRTDRELPSSRRWGGIRTWSTVFVLAFCYAHRRVGTLDRPLSMFRDGDQRYVGAILFLLLGVIGALLIRKLASLRGYVGACALCLAFVLLLIVALTPSINDFHSLCAFGLLSLIGFYYTMWLNLEKPNWLWPHIAVTTIVLFGAAFGSYGFWQKAFVLYSLLLMNVQASFLNRLSPETGVQYTLLHDPSRPTRRKVYELDREFYGSRCEES